MEDDDGGGDGDGGGGDGHGGDDGDGGDGDKRVMAACTLCKEHDPLCENREIEIFDLYMIF